jgi:CheY-like chemotaxis protein
MALVVQVGPRAAVFRTHCNVVSSPPGMTSLGTSGGAKPKILVVEDEADVRKMLGYILGTLGEVTLAADGMDAYARLKEGFVPDVIVTDLMMPGMDGLQLAEKLKSDPVFKGIPIVMLTAKSGAKDVIAGINAGARHYVTKPFKTDELLGKVRKALGAKAT